MKKPSFKGVAEAFTLVELLVVAAVLAVLVALLIPPQVNNPGNRTITRCRSNLRQVGLALWMFADDNNGQFPPQVSITNGGSLEFIGSNSPALHFQTLSNNLARNWRARCCLFVNGLCASHGTSIYHPATGAFKSQRHQTPSAVTSGGAASS